MDAIVRIDDNCLWMTKETLKVLGLCLNVQQQDHLNSARGGVMEWVSFARLGWFKVYIDETVDGGIIEAGSYEKRSCSGANVGRPLLKIVRHRYRFE